MIERLFEAEWTAARESWRTSDPVLFAAAPTEPVDRPLLAMPTHFAALANSITHQQVSMAAGRAIGARLLEACGGELSADVALALSEDDLRGAGLSRAKAVYIHALAESAIRGDLDGLDEEPDEAVAARLVTLPGVGVWTACMFLLFHLRRPDVFAGADLGLREGMRILDSLPLPPTEREADQRARAWRPYRSVASLVLWEVVRRSKPPFGAPLSA